MHGKVAGVPVEINLMLSLTGSDREILKFYAMTVPEGKKDFFTLAVANAKVWIS